MKHRVVLIAIALWACGTASMGQDRLSMRPDGTNEVLVTVNGVPITYQQIVGDRDMQAEINAMRQTQGIDLREASDAVLENAIVNRALADYVIQQLLDAQADKLQLKITDSTMRFVISRERKAARVPEGDDQAWAAFVKARYGMTPTEYRERRRRDLRRSETLAYMAGARGSIQAEAPVDAYFSLNVTPRDVRRRFQETSARWKISRDIDFEQFRLHFPAETPYDIRNKLDDAMNHPKTGVYARVVNEESMSAASDSLGKLVDDLKYPGIRIELLSRRTSRDGSDIPAEILALVLQTPEYGGVSPRYSEVYEDDEGGKFEAVTFVRVYSRKDGDQRNYEDVQVQEAIRNSIFQRRYSENVEKVKQVLLKEAAIVPETMIAR